MSEFEEKQEKEKLGKEEIEKLLPEQFFAGPRKSSRALKKSFSCLLAVMIVLMIVLFFVITTLTNKLKTGYMSEAPLVTEKIELTISQEQEIEEIEKRYKKVLDDPNAPVQGTQLEFVLDQAQLNYFLQMVNQQDLQLPSNKEASILRVFPAEGKTRINISVPNKGKYINFIATGDADIENYQFSMDFDSLKTVDGKEAKLEIFKKSFVQRINRELEEIPDAMNLPFRVREFQLKDEEFAVTITIKNIPGTE